MEGKSIKNAGRPSLENKNNVDNVNIRETKGGNSSTYLTARIARDRPDILKRMQAGEYRSVRAAAFNLQDKRPLLVRRIKELQPEASQRAIGHALGVGQATIHRDLSDSHESKKIRHMPDSPYGHDSCESFDTAAIEPSSPAAAPMPEPAPEPPPAIPLFPSAVRQLRGGRQSVRTQAQGGAKVGHAAYANR